MISKSWLPTRFGAEEHLHFKTTNSNQDGFLLFSSEFAQWGERGGRGKGKMTINLSPSLLL